MSNLVSQKAEFSKFIKEAQQHICDKVEEVDGVAKFQIDDWTRDGFGGGSTRVISKGAVIEKGGVNYSIVGGTLPDALKKKFDVEDAEFFACGISLVLHPKNPFAPTVHANYRYFELYDSETGILKDQWFGGGADMTPYYLFDEDAIHFHKTHKAICDQFDESFYPKFKEECDNYFLNDHRAERRGIGGIFFDYMRPSEVKSAYNLFEFAKAAGFGFVDAYLPILEKRKDMEFTEDQRYWQEIRRGRYVEFNLIHDRGTLFGLKTKGRIESILMSLPPRVRWDYNFTPDEGSEEERLLERLKNPVNWVD